MTAGWAECLRCMRLHAQQASPACQQATWVMSAGVHGATGTACAPACDRNYAGLMHVCWNLRRMTQAPGRKATKYNVLHLLRSESCLFEGAMSNAAPQGVVEWKVAGRHMCTRCTSSGC